jgi:solute carrier family 25 uncoupling protein 8/9
VPRKYPSAFGAYGIIARSEGIKGLWTGVGPNIGRNAIINAAELASYDQVRPRRRAPQLRRGAC